MHIDFKSDRYVVIFTQYLHIYIRADHQLYSQSTSGAAPGHGDINNKN